MVANTHRLLFFIQTVDCRMRRIAFDDVNIQMKVGSDSPRCLHCTADSDGDCLHCKVDSDVHSDALCMQIWEAPTRKDIARAYLKVHEVDYHLFTHQCAIAHAFLDMISI